MRVQQGAVAVRTLLLHSSGLLCLYGLSPQSCLVHFALRGGRGGAQGGHGGREDHRPQRSGSVCDGRQQNYRVMYSIRILSPLTLMSHLPGINSGE